MEAIVEKLLSGLDDAQKEVALHLDGPCLVVAGPGAGKTRCLIHRLLVMIARGVPPQNIMATTFTKNAAEEMNARCDALMKQMGVNVERPAISTFHSFGYRLLQSEGWKGYSIIKRKKMVIVDVIKSLGLNTEDYVPEEVIIEIARAKNGLVSPDALRNQLREEGSDTRVADIYERYERQKDAEKVFDFEDMLYYAHQVLASKTDVRKRYQQKYRYVMVDECQDNNLAQVSIARLLAGEGGNLMMIGDDCQGIYGWRGAVPEFMLEFAKTEGVRNLLLRQNYRSIKHVVAAANRLIENNPDRIEKELFTEREEGVKPVIVGTEDQDTEAEWVGAQLEASIQSGVPLKEHAILYRANAQSRALEDELRRRNIPATIIGGVPFYGRAEIQDIIAYLKLIADPNETEALERVYMNPPRYLGKAWLNEFKSALKGYGGNIDQALRSRFSKSYMERGARSLAADLASLRSLAAQNVTPAELVEAIYDIQGAVHPDKTLYENYQTPTEGDSGEVQSDRCENLDEFKNLASEHGTLDEFLRFLEKACEVKNTKESQLAADTVKLMTIHRSKGLEFHSVFLVGATEGLLPHRKSVGEEQIREERRLAYVAITRAKDRLYITSPMSRFGRPAEHSRFLDEAFEPELLGELHAALAEQEGPQESEQVEPLTEEESGGKIIPLPIAKA